MRLPAVVEWMGSSPGTCLKVSSVAGPYLAHYRLVGYGAQLGASVAPQAGATEMVSPPLLGPVIKEKYNESELDRSPVEVPSLGCTRV